MLCMFIYSYRLHVYIYICVYMVIFIFINTAVQKFGIIFNIFVQIKAVYV